MVPLGAALALVLKFKGFSISMGKEIGECCSPLSFTLQTDPELAINSLEDDAHQQVKVLPEDEFVKQIVARLEGLFGVNVTLPELRRRFFICRSISSFSLKSTRQHIISLEGSVSLPLCLRARCILSISTAIWAGRSRRQLSRPVTVAVSCSASTDSGRWELWL